MIRQFLMLLFIVLVICCTYNALSPIPWKCRPFNVFKLSSLSVLAHRGNVTSTFPESPLTSSVTSTGGSSISPGDQLSYFQSMTAGAVSRTMAQVLLHPAYTYKTLLQLKGQKEVARSQLTIRRLLRGADAQFLLSLPNGAFQFMVIDQLKQHMNTFIPKKLEFLADFASSAISTVICSVVGTPQMVLTDRLMAGVYPTFPAALESIMKTEGLRGFYRGWRAALVQKIPSYGLTWVFYQQLKKSYESIFHTKPNHEMNFVLGAGAAVASVTVMIPMDTIKTRLVIQTCELGGYKGVTDCFFRIIKEEGVGTLYRSLPPRLASVVPMIAIQFGVYEFLKSQFIQQNVRKRLIIENDVHNIPSKTQ